MKRFLAFWDTEGGMGYEELKEEEVSSKAQYHNTQQHEAAVKSLSDWATKAELGDEYREWDSQAIIIRVKDFVPEMPKQMSPEEAAKRLKQSRMDKRRNLIRQMNQPT